MLEIQHLSYRYPGADTWALHDVSFTVQPGQIIGLLGPNGAGKTTLIAHLSGAHTIQQGYITVHGLPLAQARAQKPLQMSVVPQEYAFYPKLTVTENLACFAGLGHLSRHERKARIAACIAFAQLEPYARQRAERLSGGVKRRLNLAIGLLHQPDILLFDEPTVGVDPQSRAFLLTAIQALARQGCAIIYTSHYMEEVEAIAQQAVIIDQGRVLRQGTMSALLSSANHGLSVGTDAAQMPQLENLLRSLGPTVLEGTKLRLQLSAHASLAHILTTIEAAGLRLHYCHLGQANLEQLFMSLTHKSLRD